MPLSMSKSSKKASKRDRDSEVPAPASKHPAPFTPPRKAPISVQPTQESRSDVEDSDLDEIADDDDQYFRNLPTKLRARNCKRIGDFSVFGIRLNAMMIRYRHG